MTTERRGAGRERDRRVKALFERVLDAPPEAREAILAEVHGDDSIEADVRALLRDEADPGAFLETPAAHQILGAPQAETRLAPGDEIADFTVVGVLGDGGGGVVYEADQREPRRRVALKMMRVRSRAGDALERFRGEAANLARLHHAAIGHVYAAGVVDRAGTRAPWIAMELVDGARNIVRYSQDEDLGRDERLRLFLGVCDALHHAHQKGVIHRDVTPGNVLVDAEGHPKVVDFGVACSALAGDERASDAVGTLAYASPEQLTGDGGGVDLRADVYGLGALLYELLTGAVPHRVDDLPVAEAARTKREVPVVPPSSRAPEVPPDLDAIVLRALAPDRESRYGSAADLAADVARFLAGAPVAAYAGGARYQLGKFVRRRRAAALAIAGVAAALVAGAGVSLWFALENAAARDHAERRSYAAEIAAAAAALRVDDVAESRRRLERAPVALRDWEWRHLASRLDVSDEAVSFPGSEMYSGSLSRDGTLAAIAGIDRTGPVAGDRFAAVVRRDGTAVHEWRFRADSKSARVSLVRRDGTPIAEWPSDEISGVPIAAISPDGRRVVVGLNFGGVLLHDVERGTSSEVFAAHGGRVIDAEFSPDGSRFATAGRDGAVRLWSSADRSLVRAFGVQPDRVICLGFDTTGARLATGCRDGAIRVFDTATGALVRVLSGHEASVEGVAVSPDGTRLASVSRDRTVRLWNLADGGVVAVGRSHSSNVRDVAFDPRGASFVSASWDGTLRVWDARTGAETGLLRGHGSAVNAVAFAQDPARLVSFSRDGTFRFWDPDRSDVATCRGLRDQAMGLAFSPDAALVAMAGRDGRLSFLDARTARVVHAVDVGRETIRDVAFLGPNSLVVLSERHELLVCTLPADGGAPTLQPVVNDRSNHGAVAVDRGGASAWVTSARPGEDYRTLSAIDVRSGAVLETRASPVSAHVIACDGRGGVAVGGREGIVAFSRPGGAWVAGTPGGAAVRSVSFDDTGARVVAAFADGTTHVLRTTDLAPLLVLRGHSDDVNQAKFLPGGRRIVSVSRDLTVRVWDASDGECVLVLHGHGYPVSCIAVSPDGTCIATGGGSMEDEQSTVKIWAAPPTRR